MNQELAKSNVNENAPQRLRNLAERVSALQGPDRALDAEIAWLTRWRWEGWEEGDVQIEDRALEYVIDRVDNSFNTIWRNVPRYTASLDDALILVPDGYDWIICRANGGLTIHAEVGNREQIFGETAALALCAASLRARAEYARLNGSEAA